MNDSKKNKNLHHGTMDNKTSSKKSPSTSQKSMKNEYGHNEKNVSSNTTGRTNSMKNSSSQKDGGTYNTNKSSLSEKYKNKKDGSRCDEDRGCDKKCR